MRELSVPAEVSVGDGERLTDMVIDNAREVPDLVSFGRRLPDGEWIDVTAADVRGRRDRGRPRADRVRCPGPATGSC